MSDLVSFTSIFHLDSNVNLVVSTSNTKVYTSEYPTKLSLLDTAKTTILVGNANIVLTSSLSGPQGPKGDKGDPGEGVLSFDFNVSLIYSLVRG